MCVRRLVPRDGELPCFACCSASPPWPLRRPPRPAFHLPSTLQAPRWAPHTRPTALRTPVTLQRGCIYLLLPPALSSRISSVVLPPPGALLAAALFSLLLFPLSAGSGLPPPPPAPPRRSVAGSSLPPPPPAPPRSSLPPPDALPAAAFFSLLLFPLSAGSSLPPPPSAPPRSSLVGFALPVSRLC